MTPTRQVSGPSTSLQAVLSWTPCTESLCMFPWPVLTVAARRPGPSAAALGARLGELRRHGSCAVADSRRCGGIAPLGTLGNVGCWLPTAQSCWTPAHALCCGLKGLVKNGLTAGEKNSKNTRQRLGPQNCVFLSLCGEMVTVMLTFCLL